MLCTTAQPQAARAGRCWPHLGFGGGGWRGLPDCGGGIAPPCLLRGHSPNPLSASSGKREKRSMAPALSLESGLGPVNRNCLSNEVLLPTG